MNNDTAIKEIQKAIDEIRHNGEHHAEFVRSNGELVISGLEMALNILNSINPEPCDDTISRQAAIDKLDPLFESLAIDKIKALPSAQPEIIQCKDCKHYVYSDVVRKRVCIARYGKYFTDDNSFCSEAERRTDERSD